MKKIIASLLLTTFSSTLLSTPPTVAAESAPRLTSEQVVAIMKTPEIQTMLSKNIEDRYKQETMAWFLELANLARREKTMQGFFDKLYPPESTLTSDDRNYLKETFKDAPAPKIVTTKNGINVSIHGQSFSFELGREIGSVLMNGKPAQDVDLSKGIRAAVEPSKNEALLHLFRTSPSLALLTHVSQANAVIPLIVVVAGTILRHAVIGAAIGSVGSAVISSAGGCAFGVYFKEHDKTFLEGCKEGTAFGPVAIRMTAISGAAVGAGAVFFGDSDGIGKGMREIRPDEVPKIQKFLKVGGALGILSAAYQPAKFIAEGYGVQLQCHTRESWSLYSMRAGKLGDKLAFNKFEEKSEIIKSRYEGHLAQKAIPENSRPALVAKMMKEHNEHTSFCKNNPGKIESAIFSDIKSNGGPPKQEAQGVRK